jgi:hypothetical protein
MYRVLMSMADDHTYPLARKEDKGSSMKGIETA